MTFKEHIYESEGLNIFIEESGTYYLCNADASTVYTNGTLSDIKSWCKDNTQRYKNSKTEANRYIYDSALKLYEFIER